MSRFTRSVRSNWALISVLFGLALVALIWNMDLSHKAQRAIGVTGQWWAVFSLRSHGSGMDYGSGLCWLPSWGSMPLSGG